jgi:DNA polymerase III subunit beta
MADSDYASYQSVFSSNELGEHLMEVHLDRDAFLKGLQMVQNVVELRQAMPILANVLLEADDASIRVTATDLEIASRVSIPARVAVAGAVTLAARKLTEIVKELPAATLSMKVQENAWVTLRCGGATYKLVGLAPDDFPRIVPGEAPGWVTMDAAALRTMLAQTSFAISHDESRYALNGVLFSLQDKEARLVATDGHRLALATRILPETSTIGSAIVPRKAVQEVARVLGAGEEVEFTLAENQFVLRMPNFLMTARVIEGQFPNYEQVLPKGHPRRLTIHRPSLIATLRRVSVMAEERTRPVKLVLTPGSLKVTAYNPELGEAEESIDVTYSGEEITIGFNSRYLLDALAPLDADQIVFELKDGLSPGVVRSFEEEGYLCVIMPMRI